jgi:hypothetical protein
LCGVRFIAVHWWFTVAIREQEPPGVPEVTQEAPPIVQPVIRFTVAIVSSGCSSLPNSDLVRVAALLSILEEAQG